MFIKKSVGKKISRFLGTWGWDVRMVFKFVRKTIFEQTYNLCAIIRFCFRWI